eukprot:863778-Prorocentrum_minimum.AAC.1
MQHQVRPEFQGVMRISPVTGKMEAWYPSWKRLLKYLVSAGATLTMMAVAFGVMVSSLNLQVPPRLILSFCNIHL